MAISYYPSTEMEWGALTAEFYLERAVRAIDSQFAEKHPELVIAFMQIAAADERHNTAPKYREPW